MARRPARGLSSPFWSMDGLDPTLAELEPCFPILLMSSIVASSELLCRALFFFFLYMMWPGFVLWDTPCDYG